MAEDNIHEQTRAMVPEPEAPSIPDYMTNPDAVSADEGVQWRFGNAPNYSNTRRVWAETKTANHATGSIEELVENLVKNWEVEASFKTRLSDWRTIDQSNYTFAMNGEAPQSAEHMLNCGTYNAIITPNEYYCPKHSDFASSHKTFKHMMPTFAWEVLEVYGGPPHIAFRWRHWGVMEKDYVGFNDKGEKVTAKAHGGPIEIFGISTAVVNEKFQLQRVDTYMDPLQMFRQIAPNGIVNKRPMNHKVSLVDALGDEADEIDYKASVIANEQPHDNTATGADLPIASCPAEPFVNMGVLPRVQVPETNTRAVEDDQSLMDGESGVPSGLEEYVSISKEDVPPLSETNAGTTNETIMTDPVAPDLSSATSEYAEDPKAGLDVPKTTEKRSFDSTQEAGQSTESFEPTGKRVANDMQGTNTATDIAVPASDIVLEAQAPVGSQQEAHLQPKDVEELVKPAAGEAVAAPPNSEETRKAHAEMGTITSEETNMMNTE